MRTKAIFSVISALFFILACALFYTQIIKHQKYLTLSQNNRIRLVPVEGQRGSFYDRNGVLLVGNRPSFDIAVIPQELYNSSETIGRLSAMLGISPDEAMAAMRKNYAAPFAPVVIKEDLDKQKAIQIDEQSALLPGVIVKVTPRREYKFKEAGSHIFGYLGEINRGELERLKGYGYQMRDIVGKAGLEKNYDNYLRGEDGGSQLEVNNRGFFVRRLGRKEPAPGKDLQLTIDIKLQSFIEEIFGDKIGACVVMQPLTGEILALVSMPDFDPNIFLGSKEERALIPSLVNSGKSVMMNRAISSAYPPGSVFKPVVAAAALERKRILPEDTFICTGKYQLGAAVFGCWDDEGHGSEDVTEGLKDSCNSFFYQAGRLVGVDDLFNFARRFGYGEPTGIDLPQEAAGLVPNRAWKKLIRKEEWFEGDTVNYSIGQGYVLATPIQVARMTAAIANGGYLVEPYVVKRIGGLEIATARSHNTGMSKRTLDVIKTGLRKVVEDEGGTGRHARVEGLSIAGKTGTAQNPNGISHAWFTGYSPIDDPKIAIVVFIEHGGKGGLDAAGFGSRIFSKARELGLL